LDAGKYEEKISYFVENFGNISIIQKAKNQKTNINLKKRGINKRCRPDHTADYQ